MRTSPVAPVFVNDAYLLFNTSRWFTGWALGLDLLARGEAASSRLWDGLRAENHSLDHGRAIGAIRHHPPLTTHARFLSSPVSTSWPKWQCLCNRNLTLVWSYLQSGSTFATVLSETCERVVAVSPKNPQKKKKKNQQMEKERHHVTACHQASAASPVTASIYQQFNLLADVEAW